MEIRLDTTLERDMDLLIMEEFISDKSFSHLFLDEVRITEEYTVEKAIHSMRDSDLGESDIVFILRVNGIRHAVHIEDKIDALAMPNQYDRYVMRAEKDIASGLYDRYSILIVAPANYLLANKEARKYKHRIQYEQLREHFAVKPDPRSQYKLALIDRAIQEQKSGYQWEANPGVVRFCTAMDAYQKNHYPDLPKGSQAWWREYKTLMPDVKLVYKANKGFCDLQFRNCTRQALFARVGTFLSDRMTIEKTGKSASVRIEVTPIWFEKEFEEKVEAVDEALAALQELMKLSKIIAKSDG